MALAAGPLPNTRTSHSSELVGLLDWAGGTDAASEERRLLPVTELAEMLGSYVSVERLHVRRSTDVRTAAGGAPTNAVARPSDAADTATDTDVGLIFDNNKQWAKKSKSKSCYLTTFPDRTSILCFGSRDCRSRLSSDDSLFAYLNLSEQPEQRDNESVPRE